MMARVYLQPGDRVEGLAEMSYAGDGLFKDPEVVEAATLRLLRENERDPDSSGEWFQVRYDWDGTRACNPHWGHAYYDDEDPDY